MPYNQIQFKQLDSAALAAFIASGIPLTGVMLIANNLSDVASTSASRTNLGLGNVENTALSTWAGTTNITTLGTIATGTWAGTTIAVNKGGTNLTSYTTGDIIYASGATTLSKLADVAAGSYLLSGGVGVAPLWSTLTLPNSATSGGIAYFSSTTAMASSALLVANAIVVGGGAGTAPLTQPTTSPTISSTGVVTISNATASTTTATGALLVTGGVGIGGALTVGGGASGDNFKMARTGADAILTITTTAGGISNVRLATVAQTFEIGGGDTGSSQPNLLYFFNGTYVMATMSVQTISTGAFSSKYTTEATTGGAASIISAGGIYAAKKIITASTITTLGGATFHTTSSALTDGAGVGAGTIATAPAAGNPTKWIGINDNGTTRYIPAW